MNQQALLPEWAPVKAVLLAWPYPHGDWRNNLEQVYHCYQRMLATLSQFVEVWVLVHPSINKEQWLDDLSDLAVEWDRVKVFSDIAYNDTWIRDYGPLSIASGYITFGFNGWGGKYPAELDNAVARELLARNGLECRALDFVCEGGALETNGRVLLANRDCVVDPKRNPTMDEAAVTEFLLETLRLEKICWLSGLNLTGDDTDGHIDTIARFVAEDTLVYSGRNPKHPDHLLLESLHRQMTELGEAHSWKLFELPSPIIKSAIDGRLLPGTYANFLIVNDVIFMPVYGVAADREALRVMARACPQYRLVSVAAEALLEQHGSLHCATMQLSWLGAC